MNFKFRDIVVVAVIMIASFPVLYFAMLLATGTARIEIGPPKVEEEKEKKVETIRFTSRKDSLAVVNSKSFLALEQERAELQKERQRLVDQQTRLDIMARELEAQKNAIVEERKKLESIVSQSDSLESKKIKQLAKVYGAMRPAEASLIMETLSDKLVAQILSGITDDRQKAKIVSLLSKEKASRISTLMISKSFN